MAGDKFLFIDTDGVKEKAATQTSAGAGDANKVVALNSAGKVDVSMLPAGIAADVQTAEASEDLAAGDLVNLYLDTTLKARKADASGGMSKQADGYVIAAVSTGQTATVYFDGTITGLAALTIGAKYYLSATPGAVTATIPTTAGHIAQYVGKAMSATELTFEPAEPITRA